MTRTIWITGIVGGAAWAVYYATHAVRSQWLGPTLWRGRSRTGVALTFDDGPAEDTERVLDALAECQAPATFFMVGQHVARYPAIARRIVADGHAVGNHSYSHPTYLYCSVSRTHRELERTQQVIADTTGIMPRWARPPCGVRTPAYFAACRALHLRTVQWSVAAADWRRPSPDRIVERIASSVRPGGIVLLHDGDGAGLADRRPTAAAVAPLITRLRQAQLEPASLADVLEIPPAHHSRRTHV